MVDKPSAKVVRADVLDFLARCRLEQARTLALVPDRRADAEKNLQATALQWSQLAKGYDRVPQYRASQAYALLCLGQLRLEDNHLEKARVDFTQARELLERLCKEYPNSPAHHADCGRAYAGLGRVLRLQGNEKKAADFFGQAGQALSKALELSPDNANDLQALREVRAERKK